MTYQSRGRSIFEVVLAICFVAFLVGFITVLCIGNYFRAKRAQERQRQRREAKQAAAASAGGSNTMDGRGMHGGSKVGGGNVDYEAPVLPQAGGAPGRLL
mmetsp:Transcript_11537/g.20752  ORF Transcript_11537/g.20752 Transcript_11537/m.20752 type:complete len:100 (+) Transcript_11537:71-370(+)|eukprot:CAMPEP_0201648054 /NCGR_PEP_ID=MMETSP0493-20130528/36980_1 /ASSEMBLY_ACC=CAM_ASM_000838 /TAXON_ID=420259 /ORGANISM="Thalassiosira gravida, Strain GMp14c1" /LENGTH=99 /DNA_ID=CAMNT_0048123627 /DNA_START=8 /DNA_END=307 /DNA_ORIENTATION=-